jgi:hypothetical protein
MAENCCCRDTLRLAEALTLLRFYAVEGSGPYNAYCCMCYGTGPSVESVNHKPTCILAAPLGHVAEPGHRTDRRIRRLEDGSLRRRYLCRWCLPCRWLGRLVFKCRAIE